MTEKHKHNGIPAKTVERLVTYRRILQRLAETGSTHAFSHEIAEQANNSAAQVRRDLMIIGYSGSSRKGYAIDELVSSVNAVFARKGEQNVALVGVGNLGRAILAHLGERQQRLKIVAAFDHDKAKINHVFAGCPCHPMRRLPTICRQKNISVGIITVPAAEAQSVADMMFISGIKGVLNFAPVPLKVPADAVVDDVDIGTKLEKVAFFCD
jgi:redox-sensing transcriptional repressor